MTYLNTTVLKGVDPARVAAAKPFPYVNAQRLLTDVGFEALKRTLPDVSLFEKSLGMERKYGQKPHDRFELKYREGVPISEEWKAFIAELNGPEYHAWLASLVGSSQFTRRYQWQYSFQGCSVSPHCDSNNKLGSHIFYFNTRDDWQDAWGGQTLLLDDQGEFLPTSAPEIKDFSASVVAETFDNRSLFFKRTDHSWHAVAPLTSPEGVLRKIFTVIIEKRSTLVERLCTRFGLR